ncbi:5978_t:CDS:1 [Ambispora gerdemannii]|uniref:ATP-dependent DNA helicase n=1 Tax=Ambispora gerdemannii TaxID=144530 RepID=A0A9N9EZ72_9GLOM|nr:5978_t:CDS:1 [Ambispora gerdemannii]
MRKTIAKFIEKPIWREFQSIHGPYGYYRAKLENKEGKFECSFGKKLLENYSGEKKICFLTCREGSFGRFRCQKIEFLNNDEEITSWEEVSDKEKISKKIEGGRERKKFIEENTETSAILQKEREDDFPGLNDEQKKICHLVLAGQNVCFLGEAGTGKSFLLNHLIGLLKKECSEELFITSYTGRTAINIHGQTLHSFAGIGVVGEVD